MKIFAPSYKRVKGVKTHLIIPEVIYCVHEFEEKEYRDAGYNVAVMPDKVGGNIARVRNYMVDNFLEDEGLIIDDDIEAIKRWTHIDGKPIQVDVTDVHEFVEMGFVLCRESGAKVWGVNILGDKGSYREYTPLSFTNTVSASFMGIIKNNLRFDENIPLKEDYDYCIQHLNQYRRVLRLNFANLVKRDHGNRGGCADYRTVEKEREQLILLQKKWSKRIVKNDTTKRSSKGKILDINPIVKVPIKGV